MCVIAVLFICDRCRNIYRTMENLNIDAERSTIAVGDNNKVIINDTSALLALIQMYHADIMRLIHIIEKGKGAQ